jgi:predicted helicase
VGGDYKSFAGICLTDTFQLNEHSEDLITPQLADNNHRRKLQRKLPIRVIIGNPPYSAKQSSGNDNNQNVKYEKLDASISNTYEKYGNSINNNSLYDSYIRAIRWASDRVDKYGVIGFITNAGWLDSNSADGLRKCLKDEFTSIYVFNLRGAIRGKSSIDAKKEGQNVFDIMTGVAITIFVKNPDAKAQGKIFYYAMPDAKNRVEKLNIISTMGSVGNMVKTGSLFQEIMPDKYNDWITQRNDSFYNHIAIGNKKDKDAIVIFDNYSRGLATARDAWVYNFSKNKLIVNVSRMIAFYSSELDRYNSSDVKNHQPTNLSDAEKYVAHFVNKDATQISWNRGLLQSFAKGIYAPINLHSVIQAVYRPFTKMVCYFNKSYNDMIYQIPKIFPEPHINNIVIAITGLGASKGIYAIVSNIMIDLNLLEAGCQCFPMYLYEPMNGNGNHSLLDAIHDDVIVTAPSGTQYRQKDAITDAGLKHFVDYYQDSTITKEDLFYYIYGILHSSCYKDKYANNLTKSLPHIPRVKTIADFRAYSTAGQSLAQLHLDYEQAELYPVTFSQDITNLANADFYVRKMKFANKNDKSKIIYNDKITISAIPLQAYQYVVNGKSAIDWVMERQGVSTDKDSGITNDANDWANETMQNAKYPLELLQRIITISIKTMQIIDTLPKLDC